MFNRKTISASLCLTLLSAAPAMPQAEINPDHFADPPYAQTVYAGSEQSRTMDAMPPEIEAQLVVVEQTREEATSAGIVGDSAGMYIDAQRDEALKLDQMVAAYNNAADAVARSR
jgi:hypothetical protein